MQNNENLFPQIYEKCENYLNALLQENLVITRKDDHMHYLTDKKTGVKIECRTVFYSDSTMLNNCSQDQMLMWNEFGMNEPWTKVNTMCYGEPDEKFGRASIEYMPFYKKDGDEEKII